MVKVHVKGIFMTQTQASGIILKEQDGDRTLPIVIGEYEAQSIAMALEKLSPPRPITHDLTVNLLQQIGVELVSVVITELKDNTYYAVIHMEKDIETYDIDARPSDAIALAVRLEAAIYVEDEVMNQASYISDEDKETDVQNILVENKTNELDELKSQLKRAVESEEYEKAAQLRDQIKKLETSS